MSPNRFNAISWCLHLSDPDEEQKNERKTGTPQRDRLFKVKPLYEDIMLACKACYHPEQQQSIDETRIQTVFTTKTRRNWEIKLFVLAGMHGYTWIFFICEGKTADQLTDGLVYSVVMTSSQLMTDLDQKCNFGLWDYALGS